MLRVVSFLKTQLRLKGFSIVHPFQAGVYNSAVAEKYRLECRDEEQLVVLIGNDQSIWSTFVDDCGRKIDEVDKIHPLNQYVVNSISECIKRLPAEMQFRKVYWAHDTEIGKMVAIQKMTHVSGLAPLETISHLNVHESYGTWFALRAVLVFDVKGPVSEMKELDELGDRSKVEEAMKVALEGKVQPNWLAWLRARDAVQPNHPAMYEISQMLFHYYRSDAESRWKVLKACIENRFIDYCLTPPTKLVVQCRKLIQNELKSVAADGVLLSGGLDSSILVQAVHKDLEYNGVCDTIVKSIRGAYTVQVSLDGNDVDFAAQVCKHSNIKHYPIRVDIETLLKEEAPFVCKTLVSFDPMELRNAIVMSRALRKAKELGHKIMLTGDGADELFAGYSFFHNMEDAKYCAYRDHMITIMRFSTKLLGQAIGIRVVSPYLSPNVVQFAKSLHMSSLVGAMTPIAIQERKYGKLILRQAFPECTSQWRIKEPIEVGAGTTQLRKGYFTSIPDFESIQSTILKRDDVFIRDEEHYYFYKVFLKQFQNDVRKVPLPRYTSNACPACKFELSHEKQDFCITCGFFPARITEANKSFAIGALEKLANFQAQHAESN